MSAPSLFASSQRFLIRACCVILVLFILGPGCARHSPAPMDGGPGAASLWKAFFHQADQRASMPAAFSVRASLNYSARQQSHRMVIQFWGDQAYPVRMDILASMGTPLAHFREDTSGLTAYLPDEGIASVYDDPRQGLAERGLSLPFTLHDLALLITGRYDAFVPAQYDTAKAVPGRGVEYAFSSPAITGSILLGPDAKPLRWRSLGSAPWTVDIEEYQTEGDEPTLPSRIKLHDKSGVEATLRVKHLELKPSPWPAERLELPVPPEVEIRHVSPSNRE